MRTLVLFALLTALSAPAVAQRAAFASPAHALPARGPAPLRPAASHFRPHGTIAQGRGAFPSSGFNRSFPFAPYASLPFPFFGDDFDPSDIYSSGYPVASQPPAYVLQAAQEMLGSAAASTRSDMFAGSARDSQSSQPLMIELHDGHYVRVARTATNGEALNFGSQDAQNAAQTGPTNRKSGRSPVAAPPPVKDLAPAVLVFRDGHSEEVRDYTIADGTLYVRGDYYTDGFWNKKIELSSLNLSQTLQANLDRNIKFVLPSSPNEVITRP